MWCEVALTRAQTARPDGKRSKLRSRLEKLSGKDASAGRCAEGLMRASCDRLSVAYGLSMLNLTKQMRSGGTTSSRWFCEPAAANWQLPRIVRPTGYQVSGVSDLMYFAMAAISTSLRALLKLGISPDFPFLIRSKTFFSLSSVPASWGPLSAFIP